MICLVFSIYLFHLFVILGNSSSSNVFKQLYDPGGRLNEVESAVKASNRGSTIIAAKNDRYVVLLSYNPSLSPHVIKTPKISRLSSSTAIASSGIFSDARFIIDKAYNEQSSHKYIFGSDMPPVRVARFLSDFIHRHTISSVRRPFAVRLCLFAYDNNMKKSSIFEVDPYGYLHYCSVVCLGPHSDHFLKYWSENQLDSKDMSWIELSQVVIRSLRRCVDDVSDVSLKSLDPKHLDVFIVGENMPLSQIDEEGIRILLNNSEDKLSEELLSLQEID